MVPRVVSVGTKWSIGVFMFVEYLGLFLSVSSGL